MIDLEAIKTKISDGKIDSYVESYLAISDKLDTLENELRQGNLEAEKNDEILEMYDYLSLIHILSQSGLIGLSHFSYHRQFLYSL